MKRSRAAKVSVVLGVSLALAFAMALSSSSHETDEDEEVFASDGTGPDLKKPIAMPRSLVSFELAVGLGASQAGVYDGEVRVSAGRVVEIAVIRANGTTRIDGARFSVGGAAAKQANKKKKANQQPPGGATLRVTLDAPRDATVTVKTGRGEFSFVVDELKPDNRKTFLDGTAAVSWQYPTIRLTGPVIEDDFPVLARGADGSLWLASVE